MRIAGGAVVLAALAGRVCAMPDLPELRDLRSERTTTEGRAAFVIELRDEKVGPGFHEPLYDKTEEKWRIGLWATQHGRVRDRVTYGGILGTLGNFETVGPQLQRQVLETAFGVYPQVFARELARLLPGIKDPRLFAMAVLYLVNTQGDTTAPETFVTIMEQQFPGWRGNPILQSLCADLEMSPAKAVEDRPPLEDLFDAPGLEGKPVIFSVHRVDRRFPGVAVVRGRDGRFVRDEDGSVFHLPHLALSASNLPGYVTNGNTPEGVFAIIGHGVTENVFIGPTPFLHSVLPGEVSASEYLQTGGDETEVTLAHYRKLLPKSWRGYRPFQEAWYAGKAGRDEVLCHGTTINPEFYADEPCYPYTPSLGCLTATEVWSPLTGRAVSSDQLKLLRAFFSGDSETGWLVVVDLDAKQRPVTLLDVIAAIETHEASL